MTKKRSLLKGVLTTTSVMAMLAAGIQTASAVDAHLTNNTGAFAFDAGTNSATYPLPAGTPVGAAAPVAAGDSVILGAGQNINANNAAALAGVKLDLNQHDGKQLTIAGENLTAVELSNTDGSGYAADLGVAANAATGADAKAALDIKFAVAKTLSFASITNSQLGDVVFNDVDATLDLSAVTTAVEIASIDGATNDNKGTVKFGTGTTTVGDIGATKTVKGLELNGDTAFNGDVKVGAAGIEFKANKTATLAAGKTITGNITTKTDGEGKLVFAKAGTVDGTVGAAKFALAEIEVGAGTAKITGAGFTKKVAFTDNVASELDLAEDFTTDAIVSTEHDIGIKLADGKTFTLNGNVGTKYEDGLAFNAQGADARLLVSGDSRLVYIDATGNNGKIAFDGGNIRAQLTGGFKGNASEIIDGKAARTLTFIDDTDVDFNNIPFNLSSGGAYANVLKLGENTTDTIKIKGGFVGGAAHGALELKGNFVLNGNTGNITDAAVADTVLGADVASFVLQNGTVGNKLVLNGYASEIVANTGNVTLANLDATKAPAKLAADGVTLTVTTNKAVDSVRLVSANAKVALTVAAGAMSGINSVDFDVANPTTLVLNAGGTVNLSIGSVANPDLGILNLASAQTYNIGSATLSAIEGLDTLRLDANAILAMPGNEELKIKTLDNGTVVLQDGDKVTLAVGAANTPTIRIASRGANTITGAFNGKIDTTGGNAVLTLAGNDARTITAFTTARVQKMVMTGAGVTNIKTAANMPVTLEMGDGNLVFAAADSANKSNFVVSGKGKLLVSANQTFGGDNTNVGAAGAALEVVDANGSDYTITGSGDHFINLSSNDSKKGATLIYNGTTDVRHTGNIGASGKEFDAVTFDATGQTVNYSGTAYAKTFTQNDNVNVNLTGATLHGAYQLGDATLTLDKSSISGALTATTADKGKIVVKSKTTVDNDWGTTGSKLESVTVPAGSTLVVGSKSVYSKAINVAGTFFAASDMTAPAATYADGAHIAAAQNVTVTIDATTTITSGKAFNLDVVLNNDANNALTNGKFVIAALPTLTGTPDPQITINFVAAEGSESYAAGELAMADILDTSALTADEATKFTGWITNYGDGKTIAYAAHTKGSTPTPTPGNDDKPTVEDVEEAFADGEITPAEMAMLEEWFEDVGGVTGANMLKIALTLDEDHREEMMDRVAASALSANTVSVAASTSMNTVMSSIADRVAVVSMAPVAARAAGDDNGVSYGAWVQAVGGQATQKHTKDIEVGYKSKLAGGVLGFDAEVAEGTLVGIAGAYVKGDVKLKDAKVGDKSDTKTTMVALYAQQMLSDDAFAQVTGAYAVTNVKAKSKRVISNTAYDTASAKFKVKGFSASVLGGYNVALSDSTTLTPTLGFKFGKMDQGSYTEKGSSQNLSVAMKNKNDFIGTIGARLANAMENGDMLVTPELRASLDYSLGSKKAGVTKVGGAGVTDKASVDLKRGSKYTVNVGAGVTAKSGMMEYGVGYDAAIAKKYVGHQGTLKVRVNF